MGGQYGVEQILKVAMLGAEGANVADDIMNKAGLFSLFKLFDEVKALATVDKEWLLAELKELDSEDYEKVSSAIKEKLDLRDDELEARLEKGMDLVHKSIAVGMDTLTKISELVESWKGLLLPKPVPVPAPE